jgi:hypothetical protein
MKAEDQRRTTELRMAPYTLFDAKRSVALFDPQRRLMIVNDASDYPQAAGSPSPTEALRQALRQQLQAGGDVRQVVKFLRDQLICDPRGVSRQILDLLRPPTPQQALDTDAEEIRRLYDQGFRNAAFPRLVDLADSAMNNQALLTARESLEAARKGLAELLERWRAAPAEAGEQPPPEQSELECRLYLLMAVAECWAAGHNVRNDLPAIYQAPHAASRPEIGVALEKARRADPNYTQDWIEKLPQRDEFGAYASLKWGMPSEQKLTSAEQQSALQVFDTIELMDIALALREATAKLNYMEQPTAAALVELGPALERALLAYAANVAYGDLVSTLESLTGRGFAFNRGV